MASRQPNPRASGQVVTHKRKDGLTSWYLRVRAYGRRHRINLGTELDGYTDARARIELQNVLAKIQAGIWEPPGPRGGEHDDPSFHEFASSWLSRRRPAFKERTHEHYRYLLVSHLLPVFARLRVSQLDYAAIDNYVETKQLESDEVRQATRAGITLRGASGRPKRALANSTVNATLAAADQSSADHHRLPGGVRPSQHRAVPDRRLRRRLRSRPHQRGGREDRRRRAQGRSQPDAPR